MFGKDVKNFAPRCAGLWCAVTLLLAFIVFGVHSGLSSSGFLQDGLSSSSFHWIRVRPPKSLFIIVARLSAREPLLELTLQNIASWHGQGADIIIADQFNRDESTNVSSTDLVLQAIGNANVAGRVRIVTNVESDSWGYEFGGMRAVSRELGWAQSGDGVVTSASPETYEFVYVLQHTMAFIAPLQTDQLRQRDPSAGIALPFRAFMDFGSGYDDEEERQYALSAWTNITGRETLLECQGTFGPNWLMSGRCAANFVAAGVFEKVQVTKKIHACATERLMSQFASALCGLPCDVKTAIDGSVLAYPHGFTDKVNDPLSPEMAGRHFLKKWGSLQG